MWTSSVIALLALAGSLASLFLSAWCVYTTRKNHRHRTYEKAFHELEADQLESLDRLEKLQTAVKKIYGREAVRAHRSKGNGSLNTGDESDDDWKARMERELALKRVAGG